MNATLVADKYCNCLSNLITALILLFVPCSYIVLVWPYVFCHRAHIIAVSVRHSCKEVSTSQKCLMRLLLCDVDIPSQNILLTCMKGCVYFRLLAAPHSGPPVQVSNLLHFAYGLVHFVPLLHISVVHSFVQSSSHAFLLSNHLFIH